MIAFCAKGKGLPSPFFFHLQAQNMANPGSPAPKKRRAGLVCPGKTKTREEEQDGDTGEKRE